MSTAAPGMHVRAYLHSLVRSELATKLMSWWLGKLDADNRPTTYAQAECTLLTSAAEGMSDLDDEAKLAALRALAETDEFRQQASDMLDSVAEHAKDHVKAMVDARVETTLVKWASKWPGFRDRTLYATRGGYDWGKSTDVLRAVDAMRAEGMREGVSVAELAAVSYGYGRMLLADMFDAEGSDDTANNSPAHRGLDGAHDAGTDDGRWMGVDMTKTHAESRHSEGTYDGGFGIVGILTDEDLFDEEVAQDDEVTHYKDLAFQLEEVNEDSMMATHHRQTAWDVQMAGIVGRQK